MCLAAFSIRSSADFNLVFAANRDELHERASAPAGWWDDVPEIFGGRDLVAGGSWLAVDRRGRLAAVTNFREDIRAEYARSRGNLVKDFLVGNVSAADYIATVKVNEGDFGPFNLILYDGDELYLASNRTLGRLLGDGIYAVTNSRFDTPWPKVGVARSRVAACAKATDPESCLFEFLTDESYHGSEQPADTTARIRSTVFINDKRYGTRAATVVMLSKDGELRFMERRFGPNGTAQGETTERFTIEQR